MSNSSIPEAFVKRMRTQIGADYELLEESLQQKSPISIRLNPFKANQAQEGASVPWTTNGLYLQDRPSFTLDPTFHAGAYYVQEASSMFLEHAMRNSMDVTRPLLALDLCAAPGGKSTHLLSILSNDSLLISNEVIRSRASVLSENIQKWGHHNVVVTNNDPHHFHEMIGVFDVMVVDAPCSGEGLFRKDPEAMLEWSEGNVMLCSQRQQRIISDVWPALKEGGILFYSTCTYSRLENEENLKWLKENYESEFLSIPLQSNWGVKEVNEEGIKGYRFYPHAVKGEGFFISVIRKISSTKNQEFKSKKSLTLFPEKKKNILTNWFLETDKIELILQDDLIILLPKIWLDEIQWLSQRLSIVTKGTAVATLKHDKAVPEHALALSNLLNTMNFIRHDLSLERAIRYLRKENIELPTAEKGFQLVTYKDLPLGWINHLGNRINNLYPVAWRIKMSL